MLAEVCSEFGRSRLASRTISGDRTRCLQGSPILLFLMLWAAGLPLVVRAQGEAAGTPAASQSEELESEAAVAIPVAWQSDFSQTFKLAARQNRHVFIFFRADWSPWALAMEERTFAHPSVGKALVNFVSVKIDGTSRPETAQKFGVVDFPTILITDSGGKELTRIVGYRSAEALVRVVQSFLVSDPRAAKPVAPQETEDVSVLRRALVAARNRGDLKLSSEIAARMIDLDPENRLGFSDNALAWLGLLHSRRKEWTLAASMYSRILDLYGDTELKSHVLLSLAHCAANSKDWQVGLDRYKEFLREFPRHPDASFAKREVRRIKKLRMQQIQ